MARAVRLGLDASWCHVMNRGAPARSPFPTRDDVAEFLGRVARLCERSLVEVHGYCVMDSHYHLLLRARERGLARLMRHLESGCAFRGPTRVVLIRAKRQLLQVSRYIHLNPVEAGLAARPEDWPHSSFRAYLDPVDAPPWLRTSAILGAFGSIGARHRYRRFVEAGIDLGAIARAVAEEFGVAVAGLRPRTRGGDPACRFARGALAHAARCLGADRPGAIAAWLGYRSPAGVARAERRFRVATAADPALAQRFADLLERLELRRRRR